MFLPKKTIIFELLEKQTAILRTAATDFEKLIENFDDIDNQVSKFSRHESEADEYVHKVLNHIEQVFILPLDKDDIQTLARQLDDIMDNIEQVVNRLYIYKIKKSNKELHKFAKYLNTCIKEVNKGVLYIKNRKYTDKKFVECCKKMHDIENEADVLHRDVLKKLIGERSAKYAKNTISIMKWKEIFNTLEDTIDKVEDVAILFERIKIKYR